MRAETAPARRILGAITSRTGFFLTSFKKWREEILLHEARPTVFADLGYGVLDSAMVETAAYCLQRMNTVPARLSEDKIERTALMTEGDRHDSGNASTRPAAPPSRVARDGPGGGGIWRSMPSPARIFRCRSPAADAPRGRSRPVTGFGACRGLIWMADDFDAPLDEMREYME